MEGLSDGALTSCCAMAARLENANVTSADVNRPIARFSSKVETLYDSVISSSLVVNMPERRGIFSEIRLVLVLDSSDRVGRESNRDWVRTHASGIAFWQIKRFSATLCCQSLADVDVESWVTMVLR